jgi:hypothetical protein
VSDAALAFAWPLLGTLLLPTLLLPSLDALLLPLLDTFIRLTLLLLPPPQIGSTKDARFVDLFLWHRKKVNQEKMSEDKQVSSLCHAVSKRICEERLIGECHGVLA